MPEVPFRGRLTVPDDPAGGLDVTAIIDDGVLSISTGTETLGSWPLDECRIQRLTADEFLLDLESEQIEFRPVTPNAFAKATTRSSGISDRIRAAGTHHGQSDEPADRPSAGRHAPTETPAERNPVPGIVLLAGGALIILGSILPWISATAPLIGTVTTSGVDEGGDGWITLVLGVVVVLYGIQVYLRGRASKVILTLLLALIGAVVVYDFVQISDRIAAVEADDILIARHGIGLYLLMVGVVVAMYGAFRLPRRAGRHA